MIAGAPYPDPTVRQGITTAVIGVDRYSTAFASTTPRGVRLLTASRRQNPTAMLSPYMGHRRELSDPVRPSSPQHRVPMSTRLFYRAVFLTTSRRRQRPGPCSALLNDAWTMRVRLSTVPRRPPGARHDLRLAAYPEPPVAASSTTAYVRTRSATGASSTLSVRRSRPVGGVGARPHHHFYHRQPFACSPPQISLVETPAPRAST